MDSWIGEQISKHSLPYLHVPLRGNTLDVFSIWKIARFARKKGVDVIHSHLGRGEYYGSVAARLVGIPSVTTIHGEDIYRHLYKGFEKKIIAVSGAVKDYLLSKGLPAQNITVVYNGIQPIDPDEGKRRLIRGNLGLSDQETAICMVARFHEVKGQDILIEAFKMLDEPRPRIFFVGEAQGEWHDQIRSLVSGNGLDSAVSFLGQRDDVMDVLQAMDILAAPSRWEGLGISIIEAMSLGLPVVASDVGGIPEVITHGENGLLFPTGDIKALADSVNLLLGDPSLRERLSANAALTAKERFSADAMIEATLITYRHALSRRGAA
jgi:glycosyltransferase involved in cell wall biosynthesis